MLKAINRQLVRVLSLGRGSIAPLTTLPPLPTGEHERARLVAALQIDRRF